MREQLRKDLQQEFMMQLLLVGAISLVVGMVVSQYVLSTA